MDVRKNKSSNYSYAFMDNVWLFKNNFEKKGGKGMIKYYSVKAKCGHVGRSNYILIDFPIIANSKKEAAQKVKELPRVKRNRKDVILGVDEIDKETYIEMKCINKDLYLTCHSIQEQRMYCPNIYERVFKEERGMKKEAKKEIDYKLKKQKILNKEYEKMKLERCVAWC